MNTILGIYPPPTGTVFGIFCITDDVGKGLGPFFAASLIAWMPWAAQRAWPLHGWADRGGCFAPLSFF